MVYFWYLGDQLIASYCNYWPSRSLPVAALLTAVLCVLFVMAIATSSSVKHSASMCSQVYALLGKDWTASLRAPAKFIIFVLAPSILVLLMGINGLISPPSDTATTGVETFSTKALDPSLLTFLLAPVYPPILGLSQPPTVWKTPPPRILISDDPCAERLALILNNDITDGVARFVPAAASFPQIVSVVAGTTVPAAMAAAPETILVGFSLTKSPASAAGVANCSDLQQPMQANGLDAVWSYSIHTNGTFAPNTDSARQTVQQGDSGGAESGHAFRNQFKAWETSGTVAFQAWFDSAILRLHGVPAPSLPATNGSNGIPVPSLALRLALPFDAGEPSNVFTTIFTPLMPLFAVSILLGAAATRVVSERSDGIRHSLSLMGLRTEAYWIATIGWFGIIALLASLLLTGAQFLNKFVLHSDYGLLWLVNFAYILSALAFTFALGQSVSAPERAGSIIGIMPILVLIVWSPIAIFANDNAPLKTVLSFLFPHFAFMAAMAEVITAEAQSVGLVPVNFVNGTGAEGAVSPVLLLGAMVFGLVFWTAVTVYVDMARFAAAATDAKPLDSASRGETKRAGVTTKAIEQFDPETSLGVPLSGCVTVSGLTKVFFNTVNSSRDPVEALNDGIDAQQLGLALKGDDKTVSAGPTFNATSDLLAVAGVDLVLAPGQITCLLGHNGSGKTTTVGLMTGSIPATGGQISFFGEPLTSATVDAVRSNLGVCPQHNVNFATLSAREHLRMFARIRGLTERRDATEASVEAEIGRRLEEVGLAEGDWDRPVDAFSGGMKRMLSMAAALLGDQGVILLDEPTSGCDPMTRRHLWDLVLEQRKLGRCIVFTTHELSEAEALADRIVVMKRGRLVASGGKLFLKKAFTEGYKLSARTQIVHATDVEAAVRSAVADAVATEADAAADAEPSPAAASSESVTVSIVPTDPETESGAADSESAHPVADAEAGSLLHGTNDDGSSGGDHIRRGLSGECTVKVTIPWDVIEAVSPVLEALEAAGCTDVHLLQETLEAVFLAIANAEEVPLDGQTRSEVEKRAARARLVKKHGKTKAAEIIAKEDEEEAAVAGAVSSSGAIPIAVHPVATSGDGLVSVSAAGTDTKSSATAVASASASASIILPEHSANISILIQTRALLVRRWESLIEDLSAVFWVMFFPLAYLVTGIVLLGLFGGPQTSTPDALVLGPPMLKQQGFAWVPSPQMPNSTQNLLAEQFACAASGFQGAGIAGSTDLPIAAAILNTSTGYLPSTAGCNAIATTVSASGDSMLVAGSILVTRFADEIALQEASLGISKFSAGISTVTPGYVTAAPTGFTGSAQFAGGLVLNPTPLSIRTYGGALPSCTSSTSSSSQSASSFSACVNATVAPQSGAAIVYNSSLPAAHSWLAASLTTASLRLGLGDAGASVNVIIAPLASTSSGLLISFLAAMFIGITVTNNVMSGAFEIAFDRQLETRRKMKIMGLRSYYTSVFVFDMGFAAIPLIIAMIVAAALNVPVVGDARLPGFLFASFMYLPAGAMFGYLISIAFVADVEVGGAIIPLTMTFAGVLPHLIAQSMETSGVPSGFTDGKAFRDALSFIPPFNYYNALQRLALLDFTDPAPTSAGHTLEQVFGYEQGVGYNLMWMGIIIVVEALLMYILEHWEELAARLCSRSPSRSSSSLTAAGGISVASSGVEMTAVSVLETPPSSSETGVMTRVAEHDRAAELTTTKGSIAAVGLTRDVTVTSAHAKESGSSDAGSRKRILDDWSLGIKKGEVVALLGPAGAGKTSAMRVLVGDAQATNYGSGSDGLSGRVFLDGQPRELCPGFVGYCPQVDALWPQLTVDVHLNVFAAIRGVPVSERESLFKTLCDALDLTRHRSKKIQQLSGGNKRKVGLATAVMGLPGAVISDEPSTGVDPAARRAIWAVVDAARAGAAQLVSTHSMDEASRLGDRVAIMAGGQLLAIGTPTQLRDTYGGGLLVDIETDGSASSSRIEETLVTGSAASKSGGLLPGSLVRDRFGGVLKLTVPWEEVDGSAGKSRALQLASVFRIVSEVAASDSGLKFFSVTEPTLDQVFLTVVGQSLAKTK